MVLVTSSAFSWYAGTEDPLSVHYHYTEDVPTIVSVGVKFIGTVKLRLKKVTADRKCICRCL